MIALAARAAVAALIPVRKRGLKAYPGCAVDFNKLEPVRIIRHIGEPFISENSLDVVIHPVAHDGESNSLCSTVLNKSREGGINFLGIEEPVESLAIDLSAGLAFAPETIACRKPPRAVLVHQPGARTSPERIEHQIADVVDRDGAVKINKGPDHRSGSIAEAASAREGRGSDARFFVEADGHDLRDPFFFHRDAVEGVRGFHRSLVMRDHNELRVAGKLLKDARIAVDIGIVERSVDFVEDAKGARFHEINGKQ